MRGIQFSTLKCYSSSNFVFFQTVRSSLHTLCKCHGVSGSCTVKSCWKRLRSFRLIGDNLKESYEHAQRVSSAHNNIISPRSDEDSDTDRGVAARMRRKASRETLLLYQDVKQTYNRETKPRKLKTRHKHHTNNIIENIFSDKRPPRPSQLVYLEPSPSFCGRSSFSSGTSGRRCGNGYGSCSELCCGRGFNVWTRPVKKACNCLFQWCCDVKCSVCESEEEVKTCK